METFEQYRTRVRSGVRLRESLNRTIVIDPDGTKTIVQDTMTVVVIDPAAHAEVLLRDLGTLTPWTELGRGGANNETQLGNAGNR